METTPDLPGKFVMSKRQSIGTKHHFLKGDLTR